ncbi:DUF4394 domain-containing protein [Ramlibacter sp.]|uniref:DUF4394 domain-containing protein n=1 Tax=Ramlibacter sp. TaxID=1917967 RepID=UPI003D108E5F
MSYRPSGRWPALAFVTLFLAACGGGGDDSPAPVSPTPPTPVAVGDTVALTATGRLVSFNRAAPATRVGSIALSGLGTGESLVGIDVRPADGMLYGLSNAGTIYQLDASTGVATRKSALRAAAGDDNPYAALLGGSFAVDFNPVADRLRVVSNTGQNLRINVDTGDAITDGAINPVTAAVSAAGYTNSFAGTTTTQLYVLDTGSGRLQLQDPPNNGTLNAGVGLGVTSNQVNGFDIDARTNVGYAAMRVGTENVLYSINLAATDAAATRIGAIGEGDAIVGLALAATAAPRVLALANDNRLHTIDPRQPGTISSTTLVTGLAAGETLVGIDVRPRDGVLWGLSNTARLYTIDTATGAATFRAALAADPSDTTLPYAGLTGLVTAVDFNPAADRLRVITSDGQNLRIVVETATANGVTVTAGHTTTDGAINRASGAASVVAGAYTNSFAGTATTSLYDIEQNTDQLALQNPPNNGTLVDVGALGLNVSGATAFDIGGGANGVALAAARTGGSGPFTLYNVNLTTGVLAAIAPIGGATGPANLIDLAIRF